MTRLQRAHGVRAGHQLPGAGVRATPLAGAGGAGGGGGSLFFPGSAAWVQLRAGALGEGVGAGQRRGELTAKPALW